MQQEESVKKGCTPYGVHWYEMKGHRFVDLDHPENAPKKGVKYLLPINGDKFSELTIRGFKDNNFDLWYGIPIGWDKNGMPRFNKIKILAARYYNLEIPSDRKEFIIIQHHEAVRGSRFVKGKTFLRIEDPEMIAETKANTILDALEPIQLAAQLNGKKLKDFARYIGVDVGNNSERIILGGVLEKAQKDPKAFMEKWNDNRRHIYEVIHRAIDFGLISQDLSKGFMYKNSIPIGNTINNAVEKLKSDLPFLSSIEVETEDIEANKNNPSFQKQYQGLSESSLEKRLRLLEEENKALKSKLNNDETVNQMEVKAKDDFEAPEKQESVPMFKGRPVLGDRKDENVWTRKELIEQAERVGMKENDYKSLLSKESLVEAINKHSAMSMTNPTDEDYDNPPAELESKFVVEDNETF
jgi:hypothetical protein